MWSDLMTWLAELIHAFIAWLLIYVCQMLDSIILWVHGLLTTYAAGHTGAFSDTGTIATMVWNSYKVVDMWVPVGWLIGMLGLYVSFIFPWAFCKMIMYLF